MLKSLIHRARTAIGTLFGMRINHSAIEDRTKFELRFDISIPLYYTYYYEPLLRTRLPRLFSTVKMKEWIHKMRLPPDDSCESSLKARAFLNFANNRDKALWSMIGLVAGLIFCLTPEDAAFVMRTVTLVQMTLQTWPWVSKVVTHAGSFSGYRIDLDRIFEEYTSESPVARFVNAIHTVGFQPSSPAEGNDLASELGPSYPVSELGSSCPVYEIPDVPTSGRGTTLLI